MIAAWPSFALIASYELLMRQVRDAAAAPRSAEAAKAASASPVERTDRVPMSRTGPPGRAAQLDAWQWAQENRAGDGSLPSGKDIGRAYERHERWGRLVKRAGLAGDLGA